MTAPVVTFEETHRDENFAYGKRIVDGECICKYMRPLSIKEQGVKNKVVDVPA
jgi:hypothetical protein